jgi:hypothetical protein
MQTEALFENIAIRIQEEIQKAQKSIYIAVAWFTNRDIYEKLVLKAHEGCAVYIIISNDDINNNSSIDFKQLQKYNAKVYKVGNGGNDLMHNKFCVIDYNTVITGSYNWSYKAENNFENIIVNYNDTSLAEQFVNEFIQIKNKYYPDEPKIENDFPLEKIIKRLETIKNFIILEDLDDLKTGAAKLELYNFNEDIDFIIKAINKDEFSVAMAKIQTFIISYQQLSIWNDPEVVGLKLEIKLLENQLNAFDNEKIELEKLLSDFQYRHTIELGEIIIKILKLRKSKYKNSDKKSREAEDDFNQYNEQFESEKDKHQFELNVDERKDLKKNFRKASTFCHPDKVTEEEKAEAEKIFIELKHAYDRHDLERVNRILKDLETGSTFRSQSDTISEKELLRAMVEKLHRKLQQLEKEILSIKESEAFLTVNAIADWDTYFNETKTQLEQELQSLTLVLES